MRLLRWSEIVLAHCNVVAKVFKGVLFSCYGVLVFLAHCNVVAKVI